MTDKPEALRLADELEEYVEVATAIAAVAELRRLHSLNAELLEALKGVIKAESECRSDSGFDTKINNQKNLYQEWQKAQARVVLQVEGGLIHDITADRPVSVLILDADVEGASASDVTLLDAVRDAVYIRLDEIDSQHALKSRGFVGKVFEQARAFLDGHPLALPEIGRNMK